MTEQPDPSQHHKGMVQGANGERLIKISFSSPCLLWINWRLFMELSEQYDNKELYSSFKLEVRNVWSVFFITFLPLWCLHHI